MKTSGLGLHTNRKLILVRKSISELVRKKQQRQMTNFAKAERKKTISTLTSRLACDSAHF